eukprot:CAMPEP_0204351690 /NCGR_PEP_ID=MMETSP0469-20131031/31302_1 /ASSEMBLY_ACC=CAM_ASM_000384 /TAXON_ID=2969 /ORGANISM="Oxyrrhis marina" /LENGTH=777 /DNA_ID=CAMNT_0051338287 /DNA_START=10 /DNA_END=2340 /DNA_ORIENTATION=-
MESSLGALLRSAVLPPGEVLRNWRRHFDPDLKGQVNFIDFCRAWSETGLKGDVVGLWRECVATRVRGSGEEESMYFRCRDERMTLADIDPALHAAFREFTQNIKAQFKGGMKAYSELCASAQVSTSQGLDYDCFIRAANRCNFPLPNQEWMIKELFNGMDLKSREVLTEDEFMFLEPQFGVSTVSPEESRRFTRRTALLCRVGTRWDEDTTSLLRRARARSRICGAKELAKFKNLLVQQYGSVARAWRMVLDINGVGSVTKTELFRAVHGMGFLGDVRSLWRALDLDGTGVTTLAELAPRTAFLLAKFRRWCIDLHGSCVALFEQWHEDLRVGRGAKRQTAFDRAVMSLQRRSVVGFGEVEPCKSLRAASRQAQRMRQAEVAMGTIEARSVAVSSFLCRLQASAFVPPPGWTKEDLVPCLDAKQAGVLAAEDFSFLDRWQPPPWMTVDSNVVVLSQFLKEVDARYENRVVAWRRLFDKSASNCVTYEDFRQAALELRFLGNIAVVWRTMDQDCSGILTLGELDKEADEVLATFKQWAEDHFGSVGQCFEAMDDDGSGALSYREFKQASLQWSYPGDVSVLMKALDVDFTGQISRDEVDFLADWHVDGGQTNQESTSISDSRGHARRKRGSGGTRPMGEYCPAACNTDCIPPECSQPACSSAEWSPADCSPAECRQAECRQAERSPRECSHAACSAVEYLATNTGTAALGVIHQKVKGKTRDVAALRSADGRAGHRPACEVLLQAASRHSYRGPDVSARGVGLARVRQVMSPCAKPLR